MFSKISVKKMLALLLFVGVVVGVCGVSIAAPNKPEAVCYMPGGGYVYCDYGMDMTKKNLTGAADTSSENKWAGYREIYLGGTWATGSGDYAEGAAYNYDGLLIDKFTFEMRDTSSANAPLSCEADLYIDGGKTKYCTFDISEFCDELLFPAEDWESPVLDDEKLALFIGFGEEFVANAKSMLAGLMRGNGAQENCNCGSGYQFMSDAEMIQELVTKLQDAYANGLLDVLTAEEYEGIITVLLEEYEFALAEESQAVATTETQSGDNGAEIIRIRKDEARCRNLGTDYSTGLDMVSCFYGRRIDTSRYKDGEEITNNRVLAFEEIYLGGTWADGVYNYDGQFFGKFRKDFKYNDNADIFWKVELGLNGNTLEFCTMRDMEYGNTSRTKESCYGLPLSFLGPPLTEWPLWTHYKKKYWRDYEESQ